MSMSATYNFSRHHVLPIQGRPDYDDYQDIGSSNNSNPNLGPSATPGYALFLIWVMVILNALVFMICGVGNTILLIFTVRQKKMQTSTNLLFINLTLSDSLAAVIWCPLLIHYLLKVANWETGSGMCTAAEFIKHVSLYVSINSLVVIALDRLKAILYPIQGTMSIQAAAVFLVITWIISILFGLPRALNAKSYCIRKGKCYCMTLWKRESPISITDYTAMHIALQYALPLLVLAVAYTIIGYKVWKRPLVGTRSEDRVHAAMDARKKIIKQLIIVVLVFVLSWAPYQGFALYRDMIAPVEFIESYINSDLKVILIYHLFETIAFCNGIFNTFMYINMNEHLKEYCTFCRRRTLGSDTTMTTVHNGSAFKLISKNANCVSCNREQESLPLNSGAML